ncbi:hypothetical protein L249_0091 [Ophiocordyceps polyrhachis-furcata BCC 54312]|uniref:Uncharacterized protein n=1 Tax=Ophiocordyceps polyrhachis-furcata BCC 54312 TaxID=1330021 RepID=A0A367LEE1_9HYPO|nr:hypothetical protein L249_0091 [Ophiocordyceps polyrhachis-furcata BCC 54312]
MKWRRGERGYGRSRTPPLVARSPWLFWLAGRLLASPFSPIWAMGCAEMDSFFYGIADRTQVRIVLP